MKRLALLGGILISCGTMQSWAGEDSPNLGVFDPFWDRKQWRWEYVDGGAPYLQHASVNQCYVAGDTPGETFADARVTREREMLFGASYEVIRAYEAGDKLSEVYYIKEVPNQAGWGLSVFVGDEADACIEQAKGILRAYESQPADQLKNASPRNESYAASTGAAFEISRESINAAIPERVAVTSIKRTIGGASIIAFSYVNASIASFLRQLASIGATNIGLRRIDSVDMCGRRMVRAELYVGGDTRRLAEVDSSIEQIEHLLGKHNTDVQCISSLQM